MMHRLDRVCFILAIFVLTVFCFPLALHADCSLSISDAATVNEGTGGTSSIAFTVTKTGTSGCSALFSTSDQTATGGNNTCTNADYISLIDGGLSFLSGESTKTIVITTCPDSKDEPDETFVINLHNPGTGTTIGDGQGSATFIDDDPAPDVRINDVSIPEGNAGQANANFNVTLNNASGFTVTVDFATAPVSSITAGTACGNGTTDYVTTTGTVTFNPGQTTKQVQVPVCGDVAVESNETFHVNLSNPSHATIADASGNGTVTSDDVQPSITINNVTRTEGNTGQGNATFTVSLSAAGSNTITVNFATAPVAPTTAGTACGNGTTDYVTTTGTLTFTAGSAAPRTIAVPVCGDTNIEVNDLFRVNLTAATNATIGDNQGQATITNDDLPTVSVQALVRNEGNSGSTIFPLQVTLSAANPNGASVNCASELAQSLPAGTKAATPGASCISDTDFLKRSVLVSFGPTETSKTCSVTVCGDTSREANEAFQVGLFNPTGATISTSKVGVIITNDD